MQSVYLIDRMRQQIWLNCYPQLTKAGENLLSRENVASFEASLLISKSHLQNKQTAVNKKSRNLKAI